jgi:hypothetical protein
LASCDLELYFKGVKNVRIGTPAGQGMKSMIASADSLDVPMETLMIGGGALSVSRIALGTWAVGGWMWGGTDEQQSIRTIHEALDRGITLFDTAPVYGFGRSEEILGKALAQDGRRGRAAIATKVALDWREGEPFRNAGRQRIIKEVEDSLRRLRTDVIDLYQVHWPDPGTPIAETAGAMADLLRAGKIRAIGVKAISARPRWTPFVPSRRFMPRSRPTICSSEQSKTTFCPIAAGTASRCWRMDRCVAVSCPVK